MLLHEQHCKDKKLPTLLSAEKIESYLEETPEWKLNSNNSEITRCFKFKDYHQTLLFINSVAEIAHIENHHSNICFGYNHCEITYSTHSAKGITLFDFICAAKIEQLLLQQNYKV